MLARLLAVREDIKVGIDPGTALAGRRAPGAGENPGAFNQALMDLGALVCTPREPACLVCPLSQLCEARQLGLQDRLPATTPKAPPLAVTEAAVVLVRDGRVLILECAAGRSLGAILGIPDGASGRRQSRRPIHGRHRRSARVDQSVSRESPPGSDRPSRRSATASPSIG